MEETLHAPDFSHQTSILRKTALMGKIDASANLASVRLTQKGL